MLYGLVLSLLRVMTLITFVELRLSAASGPEFITALETLTASPEVAEGADDTMDVPSSMATHRVGNAGPNADDVRLAAQGSMTLILPVADGG